MCFISNFGVDGSFAHIYWDIRTERRRTFYTATHYEQLKLFVEFAMERKRIFILQAVLGYDENGNSTLEYHFNKFHLIFAPTDTHYGNLTFLGHPWTVEELLKDYVALYRHFRPKRKCPPLDIAREIHMRNFLWYSFMGNMPDHIYT